jgi:hypothetical protein
VLAAPLRLISNPPEEEESARPDRSKSKSVPSCGIEFRFISAAPPEPTVTVSISDIVIFYFLSAT